MTLNPHPRLAPPREPRPQVSGASKRLAATKAAVLDVDDLGRKSLVFLAGFSLYGSLNPWGRPQIGAFLLHPYLVVLMLMAVIAGLNTVVGIASRYRWAFGTYLVLFTLLSQQESLEYVEPIKLALSLFTIVILATTLRDRNEVVLATLGTTIAIGLVSLPAIVSPATSVVGAEGLAGGFGNKNAFSLYALPVIMLATHFAIDATVSKRIRIIMAVGAGLGSIAILSTGNRSGYLGLAIIGLLVVVRRRRIRDAVLVVVFGTLVFTLLTVVGSSDAFWFRVNTPTTSQKSDEVRLNIIDNAIKIGFHDPVVGVGPPNVSANIATSVGHGSDVRVIGRLDAHNLYAYNFAGGGFTLLLSMLAVFLVMMLRPEEWQSGTPPSHRARDSLMLLQSLVLLFLIRAWFSEDAFTTPGFPIAFGLCIALVHLDTKAAFADATPEATPSGTAPGNEPTHPDLFAQARALRRHVADRATTHRR